MSKIEINYEERKTQEYLKDGIRIIDEALLMNVSPPGDFRGTTTLNKCKANLSTSNTKLKELSVWLENSQREFGLAVSDMDRSLGSIPKMEVLPGENLVKRT